MTTDFYGSAIHGIDLSQALHFYKADTFPTIHPVHWLTSHFAVGGYSSLQRLSGMLTAHMTQIAPHNGFTWHPHRGLEIYTYVIEGELYHEDITGGRGTVRAGEVQRMFSGEYIQHQELNRSDDLTRVIQIWYVADLEHRGLPPHYEQVKIADMNSRIVGDGVVREIIGPAGATESHVTTRLTNTVIPPGGAATIELPERGEDLFLYFVDGQGSATALGLDANVNLYDVILASPQSEPVRIHAGEIPLNYLSFYLRPFMGANYRR